MADKRKITIFCQNGTKIDQTWSSNFQIGETVIKPGKTVRHIIEIDKSETRFQIGVQANGNFTGVSLLYDWDAQHFSLFPQSNDFSLPQNLKRTVQVRCLFTGEDKRLGLTLISSVIEDATEEPEV